MPKAPPQWAGKTPAGYTQYQFQKSLNRADTAMRKELKLEWHSIKLKTKESGGAAPAKKAGKAAAAAVAVGAKENEKQFIARKLLAARGSGALRKNALKKDLEMAAAEGCALSAYLGKKGKK